MKDRYGKHRELYQPYNPLSSSKLPAEPEFIYAAFTE